MGFILFDVIVNGLADSLLLVYRSAMGFCMLIFCPEALPDCLVSSSSVPLASLGFSMRNIMSSEDSNNFTFLSF